MVGIDGQYDTVSHQKGSCDNCATRLQKISCKAFHRKAKLLTFKDLSTIFCRRLKIFKSITGKLTNSPFSDTRLFYYTKTFVKN